MHNNSYADILLFAVRGERLRLNNEHASGSKVKVHLTEESLNSLISPVEMNPFGQTQRQNDIILGLLVIQSRVTGGNIVTLREKERERELQ